MCLTSLFKCVIYSFSDCSCEMYVLSRTFGYVQCFLIEKTLKIFLKIPDIISFMVQWRGTKKEKSLCKWGNFCLDFLSKFPYFYMYLIGCWCLTPTCQVFVFPNVGLFRFSHIDFIHPPIPTSSHILGGKHHSSDSLSVQFRKSATQIGRLTKTQL